MRKTWPTAKGWGIFQLMLPHRRERRLTYLLYHCGLKPREIVHSAEEWSDIQEIYRLRRKIMIDCYLKETSSAGSSR